MLLFLVAAIVNGRSVEMIVPADCYVCGGVADFWGEIFRHDGVGRTLTDYGFYCDQDLSRFWQLANKSDRVGAVSLYSGDCYDKLFFALHNEHPFEHFDPNFLRNFFSARFEGDSLLREILVG